MLRKRIIKLHDVGEVPELPLMIELVKGTASISILLAGTDPQEQSIISAEIESTEQMEEIQVDPSNTTAEDEEQVTVAEVITNVE